MLKKVPSGIYNKEKKECIMRREITIVVKKDYTLRVGPPPEFDRRSAYARLTASKTNTKLLTQSITCTASPP